MIEDAILSMWTRRLRQKMAPAERQTCTSETLRWHVSCHHQLSALGPSTRPTSALSPGLPGTASAPRLQFTPSEDVATPATHPCGTSVEALTSVKRQPLAGHMARSHGLRTTAKLDNQRQGCSLPRKPSAPTGWCICKCPFPGRDFASGVRTAKRALPQCHWSSYTISS